MELYTVGALARSVGLARSTLLYYDRIGLLPPSRRSPAGYRLYGEEAKARLESIRAFRAVGLGLEEVRELLEALERSAAQRGGRSRGAAMIIKGRGAAILGGQLERLNREIARLREQQRVIVGLLRNRALLGKTRALDKRRWIEILAASGLDEAAMQRWHEEFEALAPEAHQDFLEALGIPSREVEAIRAYSRGSHPAPPPRR